jgi:hypothetical protein
MENRAESQPSEKEIRQILEGFIALWRQNRDKYYPIANPLAPVMKQAMQLFFPADLLEKVRYIQPNPPLSLSVESLRAFAVVPRFEHQHSVTFVDVIVLNQPLTERSLFHSLVHAVQMQVLSMESFMEHYVRALLRTRAYIAVPFEVQAFHLDTRFAAAPSKAFSVQEEVELWFAQNRY